MSRVVPHRCMGGRYPGVEEATRSQCVVRGLRPVMVLKDLQTPDSPVFEVSLCDETVLVFCTHRYRVVGLCEGGRQKILVLQLFNLHQCGMKTTPVFHPPSPVQFPPFPHLMYSVQTSLSTLPYRVREVSFENTFSTIGCRFCLEVLEKYSIRTDSKPRSRLLTLLFTRFHRERLTSRGDGTLLCTPTRLSSC